MRENIEQRETMRKTKSQTKLKWDLQKRSLGEKEIAETERAQGDRERVGRGGDPNFGFKTATLRLPYAEASHPLSLQGRCLSLSLSAFSLLGSLCSRWESTWRNMCRFPGHPSLVHVSMSGIKLCPHYASTCFACGSRPSTACAKLVDKWTAEMRKIPQQALIFYATIRKCRGSWALGPTFVFHFPMPCQDAASSIQGKRFLKL